MTHDELLEEIEILTDHPDYGEGPPKATWINQKAALMVPDLVVHLKALLKWERLCKEHYASHNPPVVIQPCGCAICEAAKD